MKNRIIPVKAVALATAASAFASVSIRCAFAVAAALVGTGALAQTLYTATPIRDPDRNLLTNAIRINASGVVLAQTWARADDGFTTFAYHASFTYDAGTVTYLDAVKASGINDRGQIVGGYPMKGDGRIHAFLMTGGSMLDLNPSGAFSSHAFAVNASGDVAGRYMRDSTEDLGSMRGFAVIGGAFFDIGAPPRATSSSLSYSYSYASAINASGDVAGAYGDQSTHHAFRWRRGQLEDLGTLGGSFSDATDINASGDVVGGSELADGSAWRAFLYSHGTMRDLGTPAGGDSTANGINAAGHVVGSYTKQNRSRAFIYADGQVRDLNALVVNGLDGAVIYSANAINDAGQIAADACSGNDCFGLRLDPIPVTAEQGASTGMLRAGLTGSWFDPATNGQGFEVEVAGDNANFGYNVLVSWFTYDHGAPGGAERQRWYTLFGHVGPGDYSAPVHLDIYQNTGGNFTTTPITSARKVGSATLLFTACDQGTLNYTFSDGTGRSGSIPITRVTQNVTCYATGAPPIDRDFVLSGNWYDPTTSGQGITVEINPVSNVAFVAWYTYAPAAAAAGAAGQRWYTAQSTYTAGARTIPLTIYETTGGLFDAPTTPSPRTVAVGTATLAFQSCDAATLSYAFSKGSSEGATGTVTLLRLLEAAGDCGT